MLKSLQVLNRDQTAFLSNRLHFIALNAIAMRRYALYMAGCTVEHPIQLLIITWIC